MRKAIIGLLAGILFFTGCEKQPIQENGMKVPRPDFKKSLESNFVSTKEQIVLVMADSVIEEETRRILNKPVGDITVKAVLGITEFELDEELPVSRAIKTLSDLKWFENLTSLVLPSCDIYSLKGIENLTHLKNLNISFNYISSIEPVKNLINLEEFNCSYNNISSIQALYGLQKLTNLEPSSNEITDISVLFSLPNLDDIKLNNNLISEDEVTRYFKSLENKYKTVTFRKQIQKDMPKFRFDLLAVYDRATETYMLDTLTISGNGDGKPIQIISIPEMTLFGQTAIFETTEDMGFELEDMNFDGYLDVRLFDTLNGNYKREWVYLIWNPKTQQFERDERLNDISLASFDQEKKLIYGMERGSASSHWYYTYRYIGGDIQLIEEAADYSVYISEEDEAKLAKLLPSIQDSDYWPQHYVVKKWNEDTNKMEIIEDIFYLTIDGTDYEYSADSKIGKKLNAIENSD